MPWVTTAIKYTEVDAAPFLDAAEHLDDMSGPLALIGGDILAGVEESYKTEGTSGDRPWPALTPEYRRWKTAHGPGIPKLIGLKRTGATGHRPQTFGVSGHMHSQLINPDSLHLTPHTLSYLPLSEIAGFHQSGTSRMVARPPVSITERQLSGWDNILEGWVDEVLGVVGL